MSRLQFPYNYRRKIKIDKSQNYKKYSDFELLLFMVFHLLWFLTMQQYLPKYIAPGHLATNGLTKRNIESLKQISAVQT